MGWLVGGNWFRFTGDMKNDVSFEDGGEIEAVTTGSHLRPKSSLAVPSGPLRSPARELKSDDSFTDGSLSV